MDTDQEVADTAASMLKAELRREMKRLLRAARPEFGSRSALLCQMLRAFPGWAPAGTVGLFAPLPDEPDLMLLLDEPGKRFVFPRIVPEGLEWHPVADPSGLKPNPASANRLLREPDGHAELDPREIELLLVPGLAFTLEGARLGRGGGYYDRALAALHPEARTVGVCFEFQLLPILPMEGHDQRVGSVVYG